MRSAPDKCLHIRFCRASDCGAMFFVCKRCDRGQRYCSPNCRQLVRRQQLRVANSRYQRTERGRLAHLRRQRIFRQKRSAESVTDQGTPVVIQASCKLPPVSPRCVVCLFRTDWIDPFDQLYSRRWRKFTRRQTGARSKKCVYS
jgi:hypothetical protein